MIVCHRTVAERLQYIRVVPGVELKVIGPFRIISGVNLGITPLHVTIRANGGKSSSELAIYKNFDAGFLMGGFLKFGSIIFLAK